MVDTAGWFEPLPDEDLFRIDPGAGTVEVVARRTAAVLFAHGTNPLTGQLWQLGTDAHNADPAMQTEAAVRGRFATNRLTITQPSSGPPASNHLEIDLDALAAGEDDRILAQPYALAFLR